ncbi:hypothetical protein J8F10_08465 [Gemmata sp. G18]|uniref:Uncharacterized protein n=1 Tax=Gemmata palustris TaxID=2822762 RepID=A0ABS5BNK1_9BACT|nr:hypothetical protein [Gemmata palustris]MBP3955312.1 hypothetical protein [Gemmata palustris]
MRRHGKAVLNTSEGPVYRLTVAGDGWEKVGAVAQTRIVARLVPFGADRLCSSAAPRPVGVEM